MCSSKLQEWLEKNPNHDARLSSVDMELKKDCKYRLYATCTNYNYDKEYENRHKLGW